MTEKDPENAVATWKAPQCPFTIEYSLRALDDIRLAVTDAFFSLPRGGAEIGGILLGQHLKRRLVIEDYVALDCEHAFGPSFALSPRDHTRLAELLASAERNSDRLKPVGWYHSHTRSEIFLSEADQDLHNRCFPEPWQVALVLKPHTFHPTRAGFFFREADGAIHATASYQEFVLTPLPVRPVPGGVPPAADPAPSARLRHGPGPRGPVIAVAAGAAALDPAPGPGGTPGTAPEPASEAQPPAGRHLAGRLWRGFAAVLALAIGLAVLAVGFQTRNLWLPGLMAAIRPAPQLSIGIAAIDSDGQLQIRWDRDSLAARQGADAILEIDDGPVPRDIQLDALELRTGTFTYGRRGEQVGVKLTIHLSNGQQVRATTSFLGKLPERKPQPEDPEVREQRDALAEQAAKLKSDLTAEVARTRRLEQSLNEVKKTLREQQRKRMDSQSPGK
jgi:proteasome lid subunit RPN8/RPN11